MSDAARRIADRQEPRIRRLFLEALETGGDLAVAALTEALVAGRINEAITIAVEALNLLGLADSILGPLRDIISGSATVTGGSFGLSFTVDNPLVRRAAEEHAARLVTGVTQESREAIRQAILRGIDDRVPPRVLAREIRSLIGLTQRDAGAVDRMLRGMIEDGFDDDRALARAQRYADKLLNRRAEMIARTETIDAQTRGQRMAWNQAVDEGLIPRTAQIVWIVTPDDRLCPQCSPMAGQTVGVYDAFVAREEATGTIDPSFGTDPYTGPTRPLAEFITAQGPPLHPQCRCALGLVA